MYFDQQKILLGAVVLLIIGEASLFYLYASGASPLKAVPQATNTQAPQPVDAGASANVSPGSAIKDMFGTVSSVSGNTLTYVAGQTSIKVSVPANVLLGAITGPSDSAAMQQALDAYNKQLAVLLRDPQKNQVAIETLMLPVAAAPLRLSDLKPGDTVDVKYNQLQSSGSSYAVMAVYRIPALPPAAAAGSQY
ncbi:MAG: hypothetical protein KGH79_03945 [Patescibacteria group bacterium]|nr:hypothetical protein [Patescibacteria group bacterium]